ncbi:MULTISPECIES: hypothetical protein [Acinetobacter]|uniref:hypothetical protein n=1 Tax=Acinetobacter TaxID=469 RepID=UPI002FCA9B47
MLTILVEIMMSVFIANFKASEHPVINVVARGFVLMFVCFFVGALACMIEGNTIPFIWGLKISFVGGVVGTILIFLIEVACNLIWGRKDK